MMVFDISDPAAPSLSSTIAAGTRPFALTVADGYAYVLNYNSNTMTVVDISDPATPSISATIATGSNRLRSPFQAAMPMSRTIRPIT
ncbi:MAG: hypothetical protein R2818_06905 [Flavobacteriales bacterium]